MLFFLINVMLPLLLLLMLEYLAVNSDCKLVKFSQSKKNCRRGAFFQHFGEAVQECDGIFSVLTFVQELNFLNLDIYVVSCRNV